MFLSYSLSDFIVYEADSGAAALAAMQELRPDCVLLDYQLPDMDGFQVLEKIRSPNGDPMFAVILTTGHGDEALAATAVQTGAQDYLSKDVLNEKSLLMTIRSSIDRFELIRARREHEERLSLFIDRAPAAVAMFDRDMRFMKVSRRYVRDAISNVMEPEDLIGRSLYEIMPDTPAKWRTAYRRVLAGETLSKTDDCFMRADGRIDWWQWEMVPWFEADGAVKGILLFAERINTRKEADNAVRASEERLRLSQEAGGIGSWDWDIQTGHLHWSDQQYRLHGLDPVKDGPVDYNKWLQMLHPEDRYNVNDKVAAIMADHALDSSAFDFRITLPPSKGGNTRWLHTRVEVKRAQDRKPSRMLGVNIDITERLETEQALRRLTEDLEKRVAEEMAAREEANFRLVQAQRVEALGKLAGGIAHDFNNVLQAISGSLSLIQSRAKDETAVCKFAAIAEDAARRGAAITSRLLTFARAEKLVAEAISPLGLLEGLQEMLFHTLGRTVVIQVEADAELPPLFADKGQLDTVLINLAVNARDAMPNGGSLTLRAKREVVADGTLHLSNLVPGAYVAISVIDTGTGMDAATLARASEPFFTTKPIGQGTGLGLAMARGFAQQSGGGFAIASVAEHGTTVTLWFPVYRETSLRPDRSVSAFSDWETVRILAVDSDDPLVNDVVTGFLADEGCDVIHVPDGFAALEHLDAGETFDLLIIDCATPGLDGIFLAHEARLRLPDLPALLLTSHADAALQASIGQLTQEATTILCKPFSASNLVDHAASLLLNRTAILGPNLPVAARKAFLIERNSGQGNRAGGIAQGS